MEAEGAKPRREHKSKRKDLPDSTQPLKSTSKPSKPRSPLKKKPITAAAVQSVDDQIYQRAERFFNDAVRDHKFFEESQAPAVFESKLARKSVRTLKRILGLSSSPDNQGDFGPKEAYYGAVFLRGLHGLLEAAFDADRSETALASGAHLFKRIWRHIYRRLRQVYDLVVQRDKPSVVRLLKELCATQRRLFLALEALAGNHVKSVWELVLYSHDSTTQRVVDFWDRPAPPNTIPTTYDVRCWLLDGLCANLNRKETTLSHWSQDAFLMEVYRRSGFQASVAGESSRTARSDRRVIADSAERLPKPASRASHKSLTQLSHRSQPRPQPESHRPQSESQPRSQSESLRRSRTQSLLQSQPPSSLQSLPPSSRRSRSRSSVRSPVARPDGEERRRGERREERGEEKGKKTAGLGNILTEAAGRYRGRDGYRAWLIAERAAQGYGAKPSRCRGSPGPQFAPGFARGALRATVDHGYRDRYFDNLAGELRVLTPAEHERAMRKEYDDRSDNYGQPNPPDARCSNPDLQKLHEKIMKDYRPRNPADKKNSGTLAVVDTVAKVARAHTKGYLRQGVKDAAAVWHDDNRDSRRARVLLGKPPSDEKAALARVRLDRVFRPGDPHFFSKKEQRRDPYRGGAWPKGTSAKHLRDDGYRSASPGFGGHDGESDGEGDGSVQDMGWTGRKFAVSPVPSLDGSSCSLSDCPDHHPPGVERW